MTVIHLALPSRAGFDAQTFRLRGVPAVGRWTRLVARIPLISAWVRPRLHVDDGCLVLAWGPWSRRVPLSTIVRIALTERGVALGLSDSTKIELLTFGGLRCRAPLRYAYNERLCAHIQACRGRALARALRSFRHSVSGSSVLPPRVAPGSG